MKFSNFDEPELEFGHGGTHVDVRFGITQFGPLDVGDSAAPSQLRVGIVGTRATVDAVREWLETSRHGVPAKESRLTNLFPAFPGFSASSPFKSELIFHDKWCDPIPQHELETLISHGQGSQMVRDAAEIFIQHCERILENGGPMVVICAPPEDLLAAIDSLQSTKQDPNERDLDEGSEDADANTKPAFHDVLKAKSLRLSVPIQMLRPRTYAKSVKKKSEGEPPAKVLQDPATRAWNLHVALYYKAGGVPWRLLRTSSDLASCFVGISFYRSLDGDRILTSVAQVFNERGEGVIVKGAQAQLDKNDRQPHLARADAESLMRRAIDVYRKEHWNSPARVVVHKTSRMTADEMSGFREATVSEKITSVELLSLRRTYTRLFRTGLYPPLRGSFLQLTERSAIVYMRGSVQFFQCYPGMYVPRPLEITAFTTDNSIDRVGSEMLSLSKLNWNNTQFDGGEPITVRAARKVGDILKCVPEGEKIQAPFRFYI